MKFYFNKNFVIWVDRGLSLKRRITVLLHEIGHWLNDGEIEKEYEEIWNEETRIFEEASSKIRYKYKKNNETVKRIDEVLGEAYHEIMWKNKWEKDVRREEEADRHSIKYVKSMQEPLRTELLEDIKKRLEIKSKEIFKEFYGGIQFPDIHCEACRNILPQFNSIEELIEK